MKSKVLRVSMLSALLYTSAAMAHTVWLEPTGKPNEFRVAFGGHAGKYETYDAKKLKSVDATDAAGKVLKVKQVVTPDGVVVRIDGAAALIAMHFDNGIHSRTENGPSIEKPMNEVPGATRATYAVKYHKTIREWTPRITRPVGQPFEVVPVSDAAPRVGQPFKVRVLQDGKPAAGVRLGFGEEGTDKDPLTDAGGVATFIPRAGFNRLWAGKRIPIANNPKYTELSYEYLLGFDAK